MKNIRLAAKKREKKTIVRVGKARFGQGFAIIAGPCGVESEAQMLKTAHAVKARGADMLRGGAYKTRTSPYSFQGLGVEGLKILAKAREETGLPVVTEVTDTRDVGIVSQYCDMLQIGSRNMHNVPLLREAGKSGKPVLLKRGMTATLEEWLNCAEYILKEGNPDVVLCERGIRTFETYTRNTLDLSAVPAMHELTHLPIIVDPSHGTGKVSLIGPMCMAGAACGADGTMLEVHPNPKMAKSDREQSLTPEQFGIIAKNSRAAHKLWEGAARKSV